MKYKCKCPPGSPFHWRENKTPSIFAQDKSLQKSAMSSASQTMVVERERLNGRDISNISGIASVLTRINLREFSVYSRAVPSK